MLPFAHHCVFDSAKELRDKAKKTKSDNKNKGYESCFESFSVHDEEVLCKCCAEVSKSLEEIFAQRDRRNKAETKVFVVSYEEEASPLETDGVDNLDSIAREASELSIDQVSTETDSMSFIPEPSQKRRESKGRRSSSVGQLAHFIKRNSVDDRTSQSANGEGITEGCIRNFQFRSQDSERLQQRELLRRQGDPEFLLAQSKRKRMTDYVQQRS